ncbi:MAG: CinA family protein [Candidatus Omnitrophota bacterium]
MIRQAGAVISKPEEKLFKTLAGTGKRVTISLAESCTGGLASSRLTDIPGSSKYYKGGVIAYSNSIKVSILGVNPSTIKKFGAVSARAAREMAQGVKILMGSDLSAAITGIAGPSGSSEKKPVGLAYMAFSGKGKTVVKKVRFAGSRQEVKKKFSDALLFFVLANILP